MAKKKTFSNLIKNYQTPVLVDFYAEWCGPCKTLSPIVQQVASALHGRVKVIKVNVDNNKSASMKYGIRSVPTLILFRNGNILWRQSGVMSKRDLQQIVERQIN